MTNYRYVSFLVFLLSSLASAVAEESPRPALTVNVIQPEQQELPLKLLANGSISAWQEAIIGAEVEDLHLRAVLVDVGEQVHKGQLLAEFENESVQADVARQRATLAEVEALQEEAQGNAKRAKQVAGSGVLSQQQIDQYLTLTKTAQAKVMTAKAQLDSQLLRLKYTKVLAADDGVISTRTATLGAVVGKHQELFRLIRQNRLEWRAEVTAAELAKLAPGLSVVVQVPDVGGVIGKVRMLTPQLDTQTRNGIVYVDLPAATSQGLRAGMFAKGEFLLGKRKVLTIPQQALVLREGFSYVFRLQSQAQDQAKVEQVKVQLGQRSGDRLEILAGLQASDHLVAQGATFLADGDNVKVVQP